mmetsp:Transcript_762/g.2290  ORF Transcript_762/g.2290 Transcript_762/m.2290 type:complete len:202 (-) Transcript_762:1332-1937(-)
MFKTATALLPGTHAKRTPSLAKSTFHRGAAGSRSMNGLVEGGRVPDSPASVASNSSGSVSSMACCAPSLTVTMYTRLSPAKPNECGPAGKSFTSLSLRIGERMPKGASSRSQVFGITSGWISCMMMEKAPVVSRSVSTQSSPVSGKMTPWTHDSVSYLCTPNGRHHLNNSSENCEARLPCASAIFMPLVNASIYVQSRLST